ncbi:MAG: HAD-IIA family hydrolase [Bacteroidetes bacterium]|nr:HAD-IIA family hydrolase [Bacteroidota bacterium]MCL5027362.1 HAD-IIA family hydrolase [Chloroflexota bacterium]
MPEKSLDWVRYLLIDLDGVIYEGNRPLPGAVDFFLFMRERGIRFRLVTNNSSRTPKMYVDKLAAMGIRVAEDDVFTSAMATARYMSATAPTGSRVFIIGETGLVEAMQGAGFAVTPKDPAYVIIGFDSHVDYEKMSTACLAIERGAKFIAANPDPYIPTEVGRLPGCGAIAAFITACTDQRPRVVGKPEKEMVELALDSLGAAKEEAALIGDRLDTDILGSERAGVASILVLTGVTSAADLQTATVHPDYCFPDLPALRQALEKSTR